MMNEEEWNRRNYDLTIKIGMKKNQNQMEAWNWKNYYQTDYWNSRNYDLTFFNDHFFSSTLDF